MKIFVNCKDIFYIYLAILFFIFLNLRSFGQESNVGIDKIIPFIQALQNYSDNIPQEKVYLHFDNTSYYRGDNIWFKCYVTTGLNQLSPLSKTLYVELLNPGGEIVDKRILKIENGQCHGDFMLNYVPFYSGFFEVRAYTKYMLNFGEDVIFSRLLPVFDKPKKEGDFDEKKMLRYGPNGPIGNYAMNREKPKKGNDVNLRFFPEGGNLIQGVTSRVAFEATDDIGNPVELTGIVIDDAKQELCRFVTLHEGRGVFTYTPGDSRQKAVAEVTTYSGKKYRFDLPSALTQGLVMEVDNLSNPDSIGITLRKNSQTMAGTLGFTVLTCGALQSYAFINFTDNKKEIGFQIDKSQFPSGISQIVLFDINGMILCDRFVFTGKDYLLDIKSKTSKPFYMPNELVEMEFSIAGREVNQVNTTFSLSVRDGANEVENNHNILTDLLLMSEIKGYVRNPSWYFEEDDDTHRTALDVLLMVQGWQRYSWERMAGLKDLKFEYPAEQGIETYGQVVSFARKIPKEGIDIDLLLKKTGVEYEEDGIFIDSFVTDEQGHFSFLSDVYGRWSMILTVTENGKRQNHRILIDQIPIPKPKLYRYSDLQVEIAKENNSKIIDLETSEDGDQDIESLFIAFQDSLLRLSMTDKDHILPEVTIKAKRNSKEEEILYNRSTSVAYYDVTSELDALYDSGTFVGDNIYELLMNMDKNFVNNSEFLTYKGKLPLFVVNYQSAFVQQTFELINEPINVNIHEILRLKAIKSIYINENPIAALPYFDGKSKKLAFLYEQPGITLEEIFRPYSCVVFIETYPEGQIPVEGAKGVRKTWLEGYSQVKEFYSPDYSMLPPEPDYRRTLYWNPMVTTDELEHATVRFYNNSNCKHFSITAETVTPDGMIGVYQNR